MEGLGIQPLQLVQQILTFGVLAIMLGKFLYEPVLKAIEDRKKKIKEGIELAEKMKEEEGKLQELREKEVDKGREEAASIIQEAKAQAKIEAAKIIKEAKEEAESEIAKRRKDIEAEKTKMEGQLRHEVVEMASTIAEKIVGDVLGDDKNQRKIIERQMEAIARLKQ